MIGMQSKFIIVIKGGRLCTTLAIREKVEVDTLSECVKAITSLILIGVKKHQESMSR